MGPGAPWPDDPPIRFLLYMLLRRKEICDPNMCPALAKEDQANDSRARCATCPERLLERDFGSYKGTLIQNAQEICAALDNGFTVDASLLDADEFLTVGLLISERRKYQDENPAQ